MALTDGITVTHDMDIATAYNANAHAMRLAMRHIKTLNFADIDNHNWLSAGDVGHMVMITGHWSGDFCGIVEYVGYSIAIIVDADGERREICYLHPVEFVRL